MIYTIFVLLIYSLVTSEPANCNIIYHTCQLQGQKFNAWKLRPHKLIQFMGGISILIFIMIVVSYLENSANR